MKITAPIPFAGSQVDEIHHVCASFNSDDEEYRILLPTHALVVIGGILQRNPFYPPPEQLLREFRQPRTRRSTSPAVA